MDIKSPEERSRNMAAIRSKNTKPEVYFRKLLFAQGYRFILQRFFCRIEEMEKKNRNESFRIP